MTPVGRVWAIGAAIVGDVGVRTPPKILRQHLDTPKFNRNFRTRFDDVLVAVTGSQLNVRHTEN
jgi:hypothetical protein